MDAFSLHCDQNEMMWCCCNFQIFPLQMFCCLTSKQRRSRGDGLWKEVQIRQHPPNLYSSTQDICHSGSNPSSPWWIHTKRQRVKILTEQKIVFCKGMLAFLCLEMLEKQEIIRNMYRFYLQHNYQTMYKVHKLGPKNVSNCGWRFPACSVFSACKVIQFRLNSNLTPFYYL